MRRTTLIDSILVAGCATGGGPEPTDLSLILRIVPGEGGGARLQGLVGGTASTRVGVSGAPVDCASTGRLEQLVAEILERKREG